MSLKVQKNLRQKKILNCDYMKSYGCDFCNDLRNIEPAKYIGGGDEELREFIGGIL